MLVMINLQTKKDTEVSYLVVAVGLLLEPVYIQDLCNPNDGDPVSMTHEDCRSR